MFEETPYNPEFELNLIFGKTLLFLIVFFPETCADRVALKLMNSE